MAVASQNLKAKSDLRLQINIYIWNPGSDGKTWKDVLVVLWSQRRISDMKQSWLLPTISICEVVATCDQVWHLMLQEHVVSVVGEKLVRVMHGRL